MLSPITPLNDNQTEHFKVYFVALKQVFKHHIKLFNWI